VIVLELLPGLAQGQCQAADLGVADGVLSAGVRGPGGWPAWLRAGWVKGGAGGLPVGVVPGQQRGTQPSDLRSVGLRNFLPGDQQDAQCLPIAVGAGAGS
jgi:hypothetical protein